MRLQLVKFTVDYLEHSLCWLNDDVIRKLTDSLPVPKERQLEWFNGLKYRNDYLIWGVEIESVPIGACGLKNVTVDECEYWGYIGEKEYWGKGFGKEMMCLAEDKARTMRLSIIWLKVLKENIRAVTLYIKQGYSIESETDTLFIMKKRI
jgi:RimJ/RimL family protein N-acetyltransferase